ncbi:MAG: hydrogenase nickel incorporation protein HypB [Caldilineaceae bacterium]|nr:hydrogenase nickel incorporation protein HypB [Caldilineaceae bacterium]
MTSRLLEIQQNVLSKNDQLAQRLRNRFQAAGVAVFNLVSSPGTGKTAFLEVTLRELSNSHHPAALVGDLATENDANRLARSGAPVRQIVTGTMCHLEAAMIERHLADWDLTALDFLFIENVGNLVCPSGYDLGEASRVVLLSVTEGEDKPLKYPPLFSTADVAVITKIDLADAVEFDRAAAHANLHAVRPSIPIFETSAKTGEGMAEWLAYVVGVATEASRWGSETVGQ